MSKEAIEWLDEQSIGTETVIVQQNHTHHAVKRDLSEVLQAYADKEVLKELKILKAEGSYCVQDERILMKRIREKQSLKQLDNE